MLFSKHMEPRCEYCKRGALLNGEKVVCIKRGIMAPESRCGKFRYDPLKRIPPRAAVPDFSRVKEEDFVL